MAKVPVESDLKEKIEKLDIERSRVKSQLDRERLVKITGSVIATITSPEFIEKMRVAREKAGDGAGLETVGNMLTIEGLRNAGAEIPDDFRLTSRVFEDKAQGIRFELKPKIGDVEPLGWGACAGGGWAQFADAAGSRPEAARSACWRPDEPDIGEYIQWTPQHNQQITRI